MNYKMPKVGILTAGLAVVASGAVAYPLNQALLAALQNYYFQEMLTALLLFSAGFSVIAVVILIIFLLDQGLSSALVWFGHCTSPSCAATAPGLGAGESASTSKLL